MNRMDTMTVRWVLIWLPMAGVFLGADYVIRRIIRKRRKDKAWAAEIAQRVQDANYLRWLDATWDDVPLDEILNSEGED